MCRYVLPPPTKPVSMYSNKVFITEINAKTTKSGLEYFLKDETNVTPVSIEYGELEGTAVVTFNQDIGQLGNNYSTIYDNPIRKRTSSAGSLSSVTLIRFSVLSRRVM